VTVSRSTVRTASVTTSGASNANSNRTGRVRLALWLLFLVYAVRVTLQFVQVTFGLAWPVPVTAWDSGLVSYPVLLAIQLVVAGAIVPMICLVGSHPRQRAGSIIFTFGGIYLATMILRAAAAQFPATRIPWVDAPVPTSVHIALASILLIVGAELAPRIRTLLNFRGIFSKSLYPVVVGSSLLLFSWSLRAGITPSVAAYHALAMGTVAIIVAELLMPYRTGWQPDRRSVLTDILYLGIVQAAVPALAAAALIYVTGHLNLSPAAIWPDQLPLAFQVILMVVIADFGRYWLHRASHASPILWRLHAVHHAPEDLHALNVGRFHPIEKAMQFAFDTVPFLLLGVSDTVIAGYLVFYAVNGFFQHSNINLSLGVLNHFVSGPELHRWHHAREPELSDHNFGNNLIIWDSLFGTRLLPRELEVQNLGLRNRSYPTDLIRQMVAPFNINPNAENAS
jgi:sterol desaturase/sphingolipid hydroxylase (fatty acid hydroxylase superfamily)